MPTSGAAALPPFAARAPEPTGTAATAAARAREPEPATRLPPPLPSWTCRQCGAFNLEHQAICDCGFEPGKELGLMEQGPPHPWRRFVARKFDYTATFLLTAFSAGFVGLDTGRIPGLAWMMLTIALYIPVEALMLRYLGYTPGKWLLGITLTDRFGNRLDFWTALGRSVLVVFSGVGFGIPLISQFRMLASLWMLRKHGISSWDLAYTIVVRQRNQGWARTGALAVMSLVTLYMLWEDEGRLLLGVFWG